MKLTAKQHAVLARLSAYPDGARVREIAEIISGKHPYLARAEVRNVLHNLTGKGLCLVVHRKPNRYRVTKSGKLLLAQ